jgi:hypothetical protein
MRDMPPRINPKELVPMFRTTVPYLVVFAFALFAPLLGAGQQNGASPGATQSKPVLIGVKVEAEGGGEGQGMWAQAAKDLTPVELKTVESLVVAEIKSV